MVGREGLDQTIVVLAVDRHRNHATVIGDPERGLGKVDVLCAVLITPVLLFGHDVFLRMQVDAAGDLDVAFGLCGLDGFGGGIDFRFH